MNSFYETVIVIGFLLFNEWTAAIQSGCVRNYCFIISEHVSGEILSQTDAQQWCRNNGSQLAEIVSQDVQDAVETFLRDLSINTKGLYITNGIRSSSGNWSRLSGKAMGNITCKAAAIGQSYGYLWSSTIHVDIYGTTSNGITTTGYICSADSDCSNGMRMADGQCYRSYTLPTGLSWYEARNQCLNKSGDLASFDYITSNDGFNHLNRSWFGALERYWIGIRRESWTWQRSNSDVKYSNWVQGQPGSIEDCLCLYGNDTDSVRFKWSSCSCNSVYPFLCLSDKLASTPFYAIGQSSSSQPYSPSDESEKSRLSHGATIGIGVGVGVGVGGFLLIVVVVVVIIIVIKKPHLSKTRNKKQRPNEKQNQNEETMMAGISGRGAEEGQTDYAEVLRSTETDNNTASNLQQQPPTVYQELDIAKNDSHPD